LVLRQMRFDRRPSFIAQPKKMPIAHAKSLIC
jgi:hypothetical protein